MPENDNDLAALSGLHANKADRYLRAMRRATWVQIFLSLLTQVGGLVSFPAYNVALAFWAMYCVHSKDNTALTTFVSLTFVTLVLDITFCAVWTNLSDVMFLNSFDALTTRQDVGYALSTSKFCLAMLIVNMFVKVLTGYLAIMVLSSSGGKWILDALLEGGQQNRPKSTSAGRQQPSSRSSGGDVENGSGGRQGRGAESE